MIFSLNLLQSLSQSFNKIAKTLPVNSKGFNNKVSSTNVDLDKLQSIIDKYSKGKSPLKAKDFVKVSNDTGVPVDLMLAQAIQESNIGTNGARPIKTKNAWNVGNVDSGSNEYQGSWLDGAYRYANLIKNEYAPNPNNIKAEDIIANDFVRPKKGGRYATDPQYTKKISSLVTSIRKDLL